MIPVDTTEDLGEALRLIRQLRRMTLADVDARSGIDLARISRYERALSVPDTKTLIRVLAALGYRLAVVPLIETAPETGLSARVANQGAETHTRLGVDHASGSTGLSGGREEAWPNGVRCPVVDDWCPGNANGALCTRPCNPETDPEEQP